MTRTNDAAGKPTPPALSELLSRYLQRQAEAQAAGLVQVEPAGAVVPFEAAPVQPVDSRLAWEEALTAARCFQPEIETRSWPVPVDWPGLVAAHEPAMAVAFCLGNFPQLVRDLHGLVQATDLTALRPREGRPLPASALYDGAVDALGNQRYPQALLSLGMLRLARLHDQASELFEKYAARVPAECRAAWANEQAALAWHRGRAEEAAQLWQAQAASVPVLFNRGMSALFLEKRAKARSSLTSAIEQIPEASSWHHLGRLYLALAEMKA